MIVKVQKHQMKPQCWLIEGSKHALDDYGIDYEHIRLVKIWMKTNTNLYEITVTDDESTTMLKLMSEME